MADRKEQFRDRVREFALKRTDSPLDRMDDFMRSYWMTRYYVEEVVKALNPSLVPEDQADVDECFADGPSDAGVDALIRSDGLTLIVQAKYHAQGKAEDEQAFNYFADVLSRLHPESGSRYKVNRRVRDLAADIDWDNDRFELVFITLGKVVADGNIRQRERLPVTLELVPGIADRCELRVLDETQLNETLRDAITAGALITHPIELKFRHAEDGPPWVRYENDNGRSSYIGYIGAGQLANIYRHRGNRRKLFALNIRNYVGSSKTNTGVISTAREQPQDFFFFNNGISAVATKITPDSTASQLSCERFSIINGAQTVYALAKAHEKDADAVSRAAVLVRITEVSMKPSLTEKTFLEDVTRYNNTQNPVRVSDFRSNDPVQHQLARDFAELSRGGRLHRYKPKRDADRRTGEIAIAMEEFARTVFAFRYGPVDGWGGTAKLFDNSLEGHYAKVFGDGKSEWETLTKDQYRLLAGTWLACECIRGELTTLREELEEGVGNDEDKPSVRRALERRWMMYYAVGEVLRKRYEREKRDLDDDLRRLAKNADWLDDRGDSRTAALLEYARAAAEVLVKVYIQDNKSATFVHRNWFRSPETRSRVTTEIELSRSWLRTLPLLAKQVSGKQDA